MSLAETSRDAVSIEPLRDFYLRGVARGDFTAPEIASRLGWLTRGGQGDSMRVLRALGIRPETPRRGNPPRFRTLTRYENAVLLCRAMGMDPVDANV